MRKILKIIAVCFAFCFVLAAAALLALKIIFPDAKIKAMAQEYVAKNYNREVDFKGLSLNFIGVDFENLRFSEEGGFSAGDFLTAEKLVLKVEFWPLLQKQVKIKEVGLDGVKLNIVKLKDGKFNFDSLVSVDTSAEQSAPAEGGDSQPQNGGEAKSEAAPAANAEDVKTAEAQKENLAEEQSLYLTAQDIYIKNSDIIFKDLASSSEYTVENVDFSIKNFDYNSPFAFALSFATAVDTGDLKIKPINISSEGTVNIAGMKLAQAFADIRSLVVAYKDFKIDMAGSVRDFSAPKMALKGSVGGINSKLVEELIKEKTAAFTLPVVNLEAESALDLDALKADVSKINISLGKSYINTKAAADFSAENLVYNTSSDININLNDVSAIAKEMLAEYKLKGSLTGALKVNSAEPMPSVKGAISLKNVGAYVAEKTISDVNGKITLNSLDNIKTDTITGVFDGSNFKTSIAYSAKKKTAVDFMFDMDKFTLDDIDFNELMASSKEAPAEGESGENAQPVQAAQPQEKSAEQNAKQPAQKGSDSSSDLKMDPMDIKADIIIKRVENNVFSTDNLLLKADVKDLDLTMSKAAGAVYFSAENGEIRDLDKIINSSVFLKVIFTTVKVAQKALKASQIVTGADINTDSVKYTSIIGDYTLADGAAVINKSDLVSDLATITTTGTANFVTEKLDMKIKIGLGKNASKTAAVKVGGTLNDPSFKLDVASTVNSLLGGKADSQTAQAAEDLKNTVKDVAGGIKNLFKKK